MVSSQKPSTIPSPWKKHHRYGLSRIKISQTKRILGFICWNYVQEVNLTCRQLIFSRIAVFGPLNTNIPSSLQAFEPLPDKKYLHDVWQFQLLPAHHMHQGSLLTWCKRPRTCSTTPFQKLAAIGNRDRMLCVCCFSELDSSLIKEGCQKKSRKTYNL